MSDEPEAPMTLTALGELVGVSQGHMSLLVREGLVVAPAADKGRRRAVSLDEAQRVQQVVQLARALGIAPTMLFRALGDGRAVLLPDGRITFGLPHHRSDQLVA